jgi:RNA polymerase sigma factor (sigma-70 family)
MNEDAELLRLYAEDHDEAAFAELVQRHVNLVYSVALRQVNGDSHLAADAVQLVFTDLARKAATLTGHRVLAGWLFTSARYAAAKLVRGEQRRHAREQEAQLMQTLNEDDSTAQLDWQRVRPVLDQVIGELGESDREAILLRFFEGRDYASIGAKLHLADNTVRMRVERALDKLRALLERRGVRSTTAALGAALANQAVMAAPVGLAATVTGVALAGGAAVAGGAALAGAAGGAAAGATFMTVTKLQIGLASAIAIAGATGFVVQAETNAKLRDEVAALRQDSAAIDVLKAENRQLARGVAEGADLRRDDADFVRLQQEAVTLKARLQQLAVAEQKRATAQQTAVYDISMLDRTPAPRFQARPQYPADMRAAGIGGQVVVDFIVDTNGDVQKAYAVRSSQREFEAAAIEAVSKWKFKAGQKGGRDVLTHMQVPIVFTLNGSESKPAALTESSTDSSKNTVKLSPFTVQTEPSAAPPK